MRKIVNSTFVSLDGVINHMEHWHFDYVDAESGAFALQQIRNADAMVMGHNTYEIYASAWPGRDDDLADELNAIAKHVAATTPLTAEWNNTTVIDGDLIDTVAELKRQPGKDILMHGYGPVAKALMANDLLDELCLWVHPVLAGVGDAGDLLLHTGLNKRLTLSDVHPLASGVVVLTYSTH